jgi:hypothetical protein
MKSSSVNANTNARVLCHTYSRFLAGGKTTFSPFETLYNFKQWIYDIKMLPTFIHNMNLPLLKVLLRIYSLWRSHKNCLFPNFFLNYISTYVDNDNLETKQISFNKNGNNIQFLTKNHLYSTWVVLLFFNKNHKAEKIN